MLMSTHAVLSFCLLYLAMSYFLVGFLRSSPHLLVRSLFNLSAVILQYSKTEEKITNNVRTLLLTQACL